MTIFLHGKPVVPWPLAHSPRSLQGRVSGTERTNHNKRKAHERHVNMGLYSSPMYRRTAGSRTRDDSPAASAARASFSRER